MTTEELIAAFSAGKYPSASDYAALINKISESGNGVKVFEFQNDAISENDEDIYTYYLEAASSKPWSDLPKYSICVHVNTSQNTVRVFLGYLQPDSYVDVVAGGAIMVIRINDTDEYSDWKLINNISVPNNNSGNNSNGNSGIQTIILNNNDSPDAVDVLNDKGILLRDTALNSLFVFKNGTSSVYNLTIDYDSGRAVAISPGDAVMLIYNGYVGAQGDPQFGIVSMSISN